VRDHGDQALLVLGLCINKYSCIHRPVYVQILTQAYILTYILISITYLTQSHITVYGNMNESLYAI
jgi:hypothetical protein